MGEFFVDTEKGGLGLEEFKGILDRFPDFAAKAVFSAGKSEGYRLQRIIRYAMLRGGLDGGWAPLSPHYYPLMLAKRRELARKAKIAKGVKVRGRRKGAEYVVMETQMKPMRKLANHVRYTWNEVTKTITVGFLDQYEKTNQDCWQRN